MKAFSNHGTAWRFVEAEWPLGTDEVVFDHEPTEDELEKAFPGRSAAKADEAWAAYRQACADVLQAADKTVSRIQQAILLGKTKADADDVQAWARWMAAVRASAQGAPPSAVPSMPPQPPYPANT